MPIPQPRFVPGKKGPPPEKNRERPCPSQSVSYHGQKNGCVDIAKSGHGFRPPGDVTDRERRSLYDQRSCHFARALYQDVPDVKNYFGMKIGMKKTTLREENRTRAGAFLPLRGSIRSGKSMKRSRHSAAEMCVFFNTHFLGSGPSCPMVRRYARLVNPSQNSR